MSARATSRSTSAPSAPSSSSVLEWRRDRLLEAGLAPDQATEVARDARIDLHAVLELVDRGCAPRLAVRILAPLDEAAVSASASRSIPARRADPEGERG
jgi:hypothetical protein